MSGGRGCDNCGSTTENESLCLCDECDTEPGTVALMAAAHAAGYAEAVGDIRRMVSDKAADWFKRGVTTFTLTMVRAWIDDGAHVGAAKKGAKDV